MKSNLSLKTQRSLRKINRIESKKIKLNADLYLRQSAINFFKNKNEKMLNIQQINKLR